MATHRNKKFGFEVEAFQYDGADLVRITNAYAVEDEEVMGVHLFEDFSIDHNVHRIVVEIVNKTSMMIYEIWPGFWVVRLKGMSFPTVLNPERFEKEYEEIQK